MTAYTDMNLRITLAAAHNLQATAARFRAGKLDDGITRAPYRRNQVFDLPTAREENARVYDRAAGLALAEAIGWAAI